MTDRYALEYAAGSLMARIKDTTVEAVRQSADFVAVVEERTPLRKAGARLVGPLPVPRGATPSFSRQPRRQALLLPRLPQGRRHDRVRPRDAGPRLRRRDRVARRARSGSRSSTRSPRPARTRAATGASGCSRCSTTRPASTSATSGTRRPARFARDYLAGRGLGEEICREFRLGLAIGGTTLDAEGAREGLHGRGAPRRRARRAASGGDYFERRLVFPLADARGRVLGFQARRLHDDDPLQAKYVNTPESELFTKGAVVYGLDLARAAIAREDRACVVEGNTDVIALRQAGFEPVVACMGTALTEQQLRELGRLTKRLWLAFDGDAAGAVGDAPRDGARRSRRAST